MDSWASSLPVALLIQSYSYGTTAAVHDGSVQTCTNLDPVGGSKNVDVVVTVGCIGHLYEQLCEQPPGHQIISRTALRCQAVNFILQRSMASCFNSML